MRYKECKFGRNQSVTKATLLFRPKEFFLPISPRFASGSLRQHNAHSLLMGFKQCKFSRIRSVMKGTLLLRPKTFFFRVSLPLQWGTETLNTVPTVQGLQRHAAVGLPAGKRPSTHCKECWLGPRVVLDRCGKSRSHRVSIPGTFSKHDKNLSQQYPEIKSMDPG
jgi:hypothetical protein